MTIRGRPRTPRAVKEKKGTLFNNREPKNPVVLQRGIPAPPPTLDEISRNIWLEVAQLLRPMAVVSPEDFEAYNALVQVIKQKRIAEQALAACGYQVSYVTQSGSLKVRPEWQLISDLDRRLMGWLARFGLTPVDREKLSRPDGESSEGEFGEYQE
jgi:P27 family predicted phage terminase small subunit